MQKYKAKKEVVKQVTSKLQASEIEKSGGKYISKRWENGRWVYKYHQDRYSARKIIEYCKSKPLVCNEENALQKGEEFIKNWQKDWNEHKEKSRSPLFDGEIVVVAALDEKGKEGISLQHFGYKGSGKKEKRPDSVIYERARLLPFAKEMLEGKNKATINEVRETPYQTDYEILGKAYFDGEFHKICVIVSKRKNGSNTYLSILKKAISEDTAFITDVFVIESSKSGSFWANQEGGGTLPQPSISIMNSKNMSSSKLKNVQKSLTFSGHKLQGRTRLYGMDISIENKKGSYRSGVDSDGHKWRTLMHFDYGYIRETVGVDGDHVDCYIGPDKNAEKVYVIHQNNPVTKKYDEDKCMLCFATKEDAKNAYMEQYDRPGFYGSMDILTIEQFKTYVFSHLGKRIHKSFEIEITDITENNKSLKVEQVAKSLDAISKNKTFAINHIGLDESKRLDNVILRFNDFTPDKIEKAVHKMAMTLDADIKSSAKGEAFTFKAQEQLTDNIVKEITQKTNSVYQFVIDYFDLPEIRIVSKAKLKYNGKIIYNPETGKPIDKKDWDKFVKALENYLNRNYNGMGEKIVLSAESLGRILQRLSKNSDISKLKKMPLEEMKINTRGLEWISSSASNMVDAFGETVTREQAARIEVAIHSAAIKVSRVTDNMRNDIQDVIIDGIKNKESKTQISQNLFDKCVGLNRDFQRIADTEIQNNANNAYLKEEVYHTKEGEKVYFKRFEILDDNTCKKCKQIKDKIAIWSDVPLADEHIKDEYANYAIWEGKESGTMPIGVMHPYCRGSWFRYYPEFE